MTAKEYLMHVSRIDQRINSKLELIPSLHDLVTRATSISSDTPRGSEGMV